MLILGPLGFVQPWLLVALAGLPILWLILRAIPPAPLRRRFPGVALLLGLVDHKVQAARTPWWLIVLRALTVAAAIVGFAGPVLNPSPVAVGGNNEGVLILVDGGWADARDWPQRLARLRAAVEEAGRAARPVAILRLTDRPAPPQFQSAGVWASRLAGVQPAPWPPVDLAAWSAVLPAGRYDSLWLSDGVDHPGRVPLAGALSAHGALRVVETDTPLMTLNPPTFDGGDVVLHAARMAVGPALLGALDVDVAAFGPDPAGVVRELGRARLRFAAGATQADTRLTVPPEVRNRLTRFELLGAGAGHVGAVALTDDSARRRKIGLLLPRAGSEMAAILTPAHFLRQALQPEADVIEGGLDDVLRASPDAVILPDGPTPQGAEGTALQDFVDKGGVLIRFAGPALVAAGDGGGALTANDPAAGDDPLLPVRLRGGGHAMGGAMSWGDPKRLADFPDTSPFHGLAVPDDVLVRQQMLAEPGPDLAARTLAALTDGTPLVTRRALGRGQVILFHVTANADWSNLPLSGLFPRMLDRLAVAARPVQPEKADLVGLTWQPEVTLDAFGLARDTADLAGIDGAALAGAMAQGPSDTAPPGLYAAKDASLGASGGGGAARRVALNALPMGAVLSPAVWPQGTAVEGIAPARERPLGGWVLALALVAMAVDGVATLVLMGLMALPRRGGALGLGLILVLAGLAAPTGLRADDSYALRATSGVVLAHVLTGDAAVDDLAQAGLVGLSQRLAERTAVEPDAPLGVDVEKDDLAFFPFLYWPVTPDAPTPSAAAYAKLNDFLRTGGLILFDTRDGDMGGLGGAASSPERAALRRIAGGLDIPPLSVIAADHVLTRSFYLLQDFPGRFAATPVWAEAPNPSDTAPLAQGAKPTFANQNDGVSPVIIGGNDWAAAWAVDEVGLPLVPVGRGAAGERRREMATRFGINLMMYVLTGNYKSDQVHVPALLDRLGQ